MPRAEARLKAGIWIGLRGVSPHAKLLYAVILTESSLQHCGIAAYQLDKWTEQAELTPSEAEKAFAELNASRHVLRDRWEILVRTYIRHDGIAEQPNMLKAALKGAALIESPFLRRALAVELRKLPPQRPAEVKERNGRAFLFEYPDPHACADEIDPPDVVVEPFPNPSERVPEGFGNPSDVHPFAKGSPKGSRTPPEPPGVGVGVGVGVSSYPPVGNNSSSVGAHKRAPERGSRLPEDWEPSDRLIEWAALKASRVNLDRETEKFRNYWLAKSGRDATKLDWERTWQKWMLEADDRIGSRRPAGRPTTDDTVRQGVDLVRRLEREGAAGRDGGPR